MNTSAYSTTCSLPSSGACAVVRGGWREGQVVCAEVQAQAAYTVQRQREAKREKNQMPPGEGAA